MDFYKWIASKLTDHPDVINETLYGFRVNTTPGNKYDSFLEALEYLYEADFDLSNQSFVNLYVKHFGTQPTKNHIIELIKGSTQREEFKQLLMDKALAMPDADGTVDDTQPKSTRITVTTKHGTTIEAVDHIDKGHYLVLFVPLRDTDNTGTRNHPVKKNYYPTAAAKRSHHLPKYDKYVHYQTIWPFRSPPYNPAMHRRPPGQQGGTSHWSEYKTITINKSNVTSLR